MPDSQAGTPIPVKLMNDYGVDLPLWASGGLADDGTFPITEELRERLTGWAATFNEHFDYETGWDDERLRRAHRAEGLALHRRLIDELGQGYEVSLDLWESDLHGSSAVLAGPRGRRLCLELAMELDPDVRTMVFWLAYELDPGRGTSRVILTVAVPSEETVPSEERPREPQVPTVTVGEVAMALASLEVSDIPEDLAAASLRAAVDTARYWQEPDGEDVLVSHPLIRAALIPLADRLLETSLRARAWGQPRSVEQWVIDWRSAEDPTPLPRAPGRLLTDWGVQERDEEAQAAVGRPSDPTVNWSGTWWSVPVALVHSVGRIPAGLDLIEDSSGEDEATVIPVRGVGKTYEVRTEYDWTWLCQRYPFEVTASRRHDWYRTTGRDGRWVIPDWEQVATEFDAVHLTTMGYLSSAGRALPVGRDTASVVSGWNPDTTIWLTDSVREGDGPRQSWRRSEDDAWVRES